MNPLTYLYDTILYRPLFNILVLFYNYIPGNDFGFAVIALTVLIRIFLYPFMSQSIKYQQTLNEIQPKIQEIQKNFKDSQEAQAKELMNLYKNNNINPFSVFVPLLIQMPLLIALFQVFRNGLQADSFNSLYGFITKPENINYVFLGVINLLEPHLLLAAITAAVQFFQVKLTTPRPQKSKTKDSMTAFSEMSQKQMPFFLSFLTFFFLMKLPAALGLYWITTSLFSIGQNYILERAKKNDKPN